MNDNFDEGYTEFGHGRKIQPKTGQLLVFPATWTFPHRGLTPKNGNKYIISSYMISHDRQALYNWYAWQKYRYGVLYQII